MHGMYSTALIQRRSRSHYFTSDEYTRAMFETLVTICYSRVLEIQNSRVISFLTHLIFGDQLTSAHVCGATALH